MSFVKRLIKQSSTYMAGEVLIMLGGMISFPIFTRILTKQEYGVMNLISITLSLVEEFSTLGIRHAVSRFYATYDGDEAPSFYATTMVGSLLFGVLGTVLTALICRLLSLAGVIQEGVGSLFAVASLLVVTRVLTKVIGNLYRMREQAKTYTFFAILTKYLGMGLSILFVSVYLRGIEGFYLGAIIGEAVSLVLLLAVMLRELGRPKTGLFSGKLLGRMLSYGFPLIVAGFASSVLALGDRYLIGWFMNAEAVAVYSVPYNLCSYILSIFVTGFEYAYYPLIMNEWKGGNDDNARHGIDRVIRIYCLCALPIIFGVSALGARIITVLATDKYAEATYILPYVLTGEMLMGVSTPLMIGFFFLQKPGMMVKFKWYGAAANLVLNLALIPVLGLMGAALATLASYVFFVLIGTRAASRYFRITIPYGAVAVYTACAAAMFVLIKGVQALLPGLGLVPLILVGGAGYLLFVLLADRQVREMALAGAWRVAGKA